MSKFNRGDVAICREGTEKVVVGIVVGFSPHSDNVLVAKFDGIINTFSPSVMRKVDLSKISTVETLEAEDGDTIVNVVDDYGEEGSVNSPADKDFNLLLSLCLAASQINTQWPREGDDYYWLDLNKMTVCKATFTETNREAVEAEIAEGHIFKTADDAKLATERIKQVFADNKAAVTGEEE